MTTTEIATVPQELEYLLKKCTVHVVISHFAMGTIIMHL